MLALEGLGIGCDRRDGRWTTAVRHAEPVHDVLGFDPWPHDDSHLGELRAHVGEAHGERLLGVVELGCPVEQGGALGVEGRELPRAMGDAPIAGGVPNGGHASSLSSVRFDRGKLGCGVRTDVEPTVTARQLRHYRRLDLHAKPVSAILRENLQHGLAQGQGGTGGRHPAFGSRGPAGPAMGQKAGGVEPLGCSCIRRTAPTSSAIAASSIRKSPMPLSKGLVL
jgi:hypothetical protein